MTQYIWVDEAKTILNKIDDNGICWQISVDPANSDYQAYLATLPSNSSTPQAGA